MAFHPFRHFRKHQKAYFAVLILICMLTFVFTGMMAGADPVMRMLAWIGYRGHKGEVVTTLYGDKVYESDVKRVLDQRRLAQEFLTRPLPGILFPSNAMERMFSSQFRAVAELSRKQNAARAKPGEPGPLPFPAEQLPDGYVERMQLPLWLPAEEHASEALDALRKIREASLLPGVQPDQLESLDVLAQALAYEAWLYEPGRADTNRREEFVFGGGPRTEDLLDFLVWKHQADKLGITLTEADVIREINRLACSRALPKPVLPEEPFERNPVIRLFLQPGDRERRQGAGATPGELFEALREEFRVQLAKEAIMGHGSGVRAFVNEAEPVRMTPTAETPDEFLAYFREHRTTLKVALLPIDVARFTDKVTKEPSQEELHYIYETYKNEDANPAKPTPGFRQPRRLRLQYFSVSPDSPHYQAEAKKLARALSIYSDPAASAALRVAAAVNPYAAGGWPAWAAAAALPNAFDPLREEYERYRDEEQRAASNDLRSGFDLRDRSPLLERPQVYASLVAQLVGSGLSRTATPLEVASLLPGLEAEYDRTTLRAFGSAVLAAGSGSPLTALALPIPFTWTALPREAVQPLLVQRIEKDLARKLVAENLAAFREQLGKLKNKPAEAESYVKNALPKFGIQKAAETHLDSIYDLADDPSFKALNDAWEAMRKELNDRREQLRQFPAHLRRQMGSPAPPPPLVPYLFSTTAPLFQPEDFQVAPGLEEAFLRPRTELPERTTWVFWRVEDKPAHSQDFAQVRHEVVQWWRLSQARKDASDAADHINNELKEKHLSPADAVAFLRDQKQGSVFELDNVALLVSPRKPEIFFGRRDVAEFQPYKVPSDKIAYPMPDIVRDLLTLKSPGESMVLSDQPQKHYYVAVLLARDPKTLRDFYDLYTKAAPDDQLWQEMMKERRRDFYQDLMRQMRIEAAGKDKVSEDGKFKLPEGLRKGETSSEGE